MERRAIDFGMNIKEDGFAEFFVEGQQGHEERQTICLGVEESKILALFMLEKVVHFGYSLYTVAEEEKTERKENA